MCIGHLLKALVAERARTWRALKGHLIQLFMLQAGSLRPREGKDMFQVIQGVENQGQTWEVYITPEPEVIVFQAKKEHSCPSNSEISAPTRANAQLELYTTCILKAVYRSQPIY